jgi:hypothetical protein
MELSRARGSDSVAEDMDARCAVRAEVLGFH